MKFPWIELALAVVITGSLFTPFAYTQPEKSVMKTTFWLPDRNSPARESTDENACAGEVGIDKFNYTEYLALRQHVVNNLPQIDAYGDQAKGMQEQSYDEQGLSEVPGASLAKNNFVMGPNGKILLYDVQRHQVVSPAEACHLTNMIYDGKMSYAVRTGETAFCGDEETCDIGWPGKSSELKEQNNDLIAFKEQNNDLIAFKDALLNNKTSVRAILKENDKIRQGVESVVGEISVDEFDPSEYTEVQKAQMLQAAGAEQSEKIKSLLESTRMPYNKVTSSQLYVDLAPVSQSEMYLIPETYSQFIRWMQEWRDFDNIYLTMGVISIASSFTSSGSYASTAEQGAEEVGEAGAKAGKSWLGRTVGHIKSALRNKRFSEAANDDALKAVDKLITDTSMQITEGEKLTKLQRLGRWITGRGKASLIGKDLVAQTDQIDDLEKAINKLEKTKKGYEQGYQIAVLKGDPEAVVKYDQMIEETVGKISKLEKKKSMLEKIAKLAEGNAKLSTSEITGGRLQKLETVWTAFRVGARIAGLKGRAFKLAMVNLFVAYLATSFSNEYLVTPYFLTDGVEYDVSKKECDALKSIRGKDTKCYVNTEIRANSMFVPQKPAENGIMPVLFSFLTTHVDPTVPELSNKLREKAGKLGEHVYIVDQVNFDTTGGGTPTNVVRPAGKAFYFYSVHPGSVGYLAWEDPQARTRMPGYTGIWMYAHNVLTKGASFEQMNPAFNQPVNVVASTTRSVGNLAFNYAWIVGLPRAIIPLGTGTLTGTSILVGYYTLGPGGSGLYKAGEESFNVLKEGKIIDPEIAYNNKAKLCAEVAKKYAGPDWAKGLEGGGFYWNAGEIGAAKQTAFLLMTGGTAFHAAAAVFPPAEVVGIALDFASVYAENQAIEVQDEAMRKLLGECYETNAELATIQKIPTAQDLQQAAESSNEINQAVSQVKSLVQGMSPEAGKMISEWEDYNNYQTQVMHLVGQAIPSEGQLGRTSMLADRIYDVYMHGGNVRWFIPSDCPISLCYEAPDGNYKCSQESGYYFLGPDGKPVLDSPAPQLLSLGVNMDDGYAYMVGKVVEVKKNDENPALMDVRPDGTVNISNECFKSALESNDILGLEDESISDEYKNMILENSFGSLEVVNSEDTMLWFNPAANETVATFFAGIPKCDGASLGGTMHYPDSYITLKRDSLGTVEVHSTSSGEDKVVCTTQLGPSGSVVFTRGMIRPGFKQDDRTDFSGVYHVYLSGVLSGLEQDLSPDTTLFDPAKDYFSTENCTMPDGTPGWKLVWHFKDGTDQDIMTQWKQKEETMCMPTFAGTDNEQADFHKDENGNNVFTFTYKDENGNPVTNNYNVEKWVPGEESPYNSKPGYLLTGEDGKQYFATVEAGPDGNPRLVITDMAGNVIGHGSVPMMWMNGPNGGYTSSNGKIGMTNEFYFPLNPQFMTTGANGLGMMTPSKPPWGAPDVRPETGPVKQGQNPLLSLPSIPEGSAGIAFIAMLIAGLAMARALARKRQDTG